VELFRDSFFAPALVNCELALWLRSETKGKKVLKASEESLPLDIDAIADNIVTVSEVMATGLIRTIDLNPVALYLSGALVLDAKMSRL